MQGPDFNPQHHQKQNKSKILPLLCFSSSPTHLASKLLTETSKVLANLVLIYFYLFDFTVFLNYYTVITILPIPLTLTYQCPAPLGPSYMLSEFLSSPSPFVCLHDYFSSPELLFQCHLLIDAVPERANWKLNLPGFSCKDNLCTGRCGAYL